MTPPFIIGERQTVDVIRHPEHGECRAVYDNGPSALLLPDGRAVPCRVIGRGWSRDDGARLDLAGAAGVDRVKCSLVSAGDSHGRAWSPGLGEGWLVNLAGNLGQRFDGDDGRATRFAWRRAECIDAPETRALSAKARKAHKHTDEDQRWWRYETADGEALVFRLGGAPKVQMTLGGVR